MRILSGVVALAASWFTLVAATEPSPPAPPPAPIEAGVLAELNYVRAHPRDYADELRRYRSLFDGRLVREPGESVPMMTNEGIRAVDEAISFLERQAPLPPLAPGSILALAARDHALAQGPGGFTGHVSRDGASPGDRVKRRGGDIYVGETISYGYDRAAQVVRAFIVDDGVPDRGHRTLIFDDSFHFAGVGCGSHARFRYLCVVDYAGTVNGAPYFKPTATTKRTSTVRTVAEPAYQAIAADSSEYADDDEIADGDMVVYEEVIEETGTR